MAYLVDANILVTAAHKGFAFHKPCLTWLTTALQQYRVYATDLVEVAVLRITTLPSLKEEAASVGEGFGFLEELHRIENYQLLSQSSATKATWKSLCSRYNLHGNHINEAYLAALALEHKLTLVSADKSFARFDDLTWLNPTVS